VIARPGAPSRRAELDEVANALRPLRPLRTIEPPGTLDGGDVLVLGKEVWVGHGQRTNGDGVRQLAAILEPFGYRVRATPVTRCLHLKSAVTRVGIDRLLINPQWADPACFAGWPLVECDPAEPAAANALLIGDTVIVAAEHPGTRARLERAGCVVRSVPAGELARAEGGVTCGCLLVR
jgi:dimethylargininase